ncbi:energy-coupled thiamine transporter ThiT [Streptococcus sobrinus]|nr:energy-coupled thiamine transporter ThiT [Streptococcus sobrinus]AWN18503.1 energy-coupled thiamine transporter ThiT [Streptococcus sobrinus]
MRELTFLVPVLIVANQLTFAQSNWVRKDFFMQRSHVAGLAEIAIFAGLAMVLDIFTQPLAIGPWISLSFKMTPIFLLAFRRGAKPAIMAGFIWGILQVALGQAAGGWLNLWQGFLEYFIAFSLIGFAGLIKPWLNQSLKKNQTVRSLSLMVVGVLIGSLARYCIHFIAGILFWGSYAPKGQSALLYSAIINGSSFLGETLACIVALLLLFPFIKKFLILD